MKVDISKQEHLHLTKSNIKEKLQAKHAGARELRQGPRDSNNLKVWDKIQQLTTQSTPKHKLQISMNEA